MKLSPGEGRGQGTLSLRSIPGKWYFVPLGWGKADGQGSHLDLNNNESITM